MHSIPGRRIILGLFLVFLLLPIYWLVNMSFKTNSEIVSTMTLWPHTPTLQHYRRIFTDESWYSGYINSLEYVVINTILSVSVALPAAYAFSRYRFLGDKHLFFWLLSNRMAPAAVYALPFFNLYSAIGLFDTPWAVALAHCIFNVPLAVWILEGFVSGVPREIDETAFLDGYSFPRFFVKILVPLIASGIGVAAFFCFMFSWVELLLARTLTSVAAKPISAVMTRTVSAAGMDWGLLAAAGVLTIIPGALVIWFVRNYIARGFAPRESSSAESCRKRGTPWRSIAWMAWTLPTAIFFALLASTLAVMTWLAAAYPEAERVGILTHSDHARRPAFCVLDPRGGHSSLVDRLHRHRRDRDAADRRGRLRDFEPVARNTGFAWRGRAGVSHGLKPVEEDRSGRSTRA